MPHKRSKLVYNYPTRGIITGKNNSIWAIDLVDLSSKNSGYILNCVDVFSRKGEGVKIKSKSAESIKEGLMKLFDIYGAKPLKIWSDQEPALMGDLQNWLLSQNIQTYTLNNSYIGAKSHASPIVERFNLTMKTWMENLEEKTKQPWEKIYTQSNIDKFTEEKNNSVHTTTGERPNDVYNHKVKSSEVKETHQENYDEERKNSTLPLKVGQSVILAKKHEKIRGKFKPKYEGPFKIIEVLQTNPITYRLDDIWGAFYRQQLKPYEEPETEHQPEPEIREKPFVDPNADTESESSSSSTESEDENAPLFNLDEVLRSKQPGTRKAVKDLKYFHEPTAENMKKRVLRSRKI